MATLTYGNVVAAGPGWTKVTTPTGTKTVYGDRATRNNNPGNLEYHGWEDAYGAIGDDGRFAVFGSRKLGLQAQAHLLFDNNQYANLTLGQAIAAYAPSFENNTAAYAAAVAAASGVSLNTKMKDIPASKQTAVLGAMHAVEGNTGALAYDANGNLTDTLDTVSPRTPNTAPTPYGRNSQQALGSVRPDNFSFGGPKGLFSVDTQVASPIGHVSRSPLGPVAPSRTAFSGLGTPRGMNTVSAPSRPSVSGFTSQDEKSNTGSYKNAPNAGNFTSQDERASIADRMGIPGAVAPSASPPSPTRPDNFAYSGPKGIFSVDPAANVKMDIAKPAVAPAPSIGMPTAPTRPAIAPTLPAAVPASVPAAVPARVAPPAQSVSRQSLAPARPALSPADVYGGAVGTAQTSTPGTTVSRATSFGPTYTTNKFGAVTATAPDGTQMAALGGIPSQQIAGPLSQPGIATNPSTGGLFGPKAKSATGMVTGAAIGGYALGPLGAMLGGLIGKNVAQGKPALTGLLGGNNSSVGTHIVDTFDGPMRVANAVSGGGFPSKPSGPAPGGVAGGMRGLSPGAANAIDTGVGGLY
ncbi:hypothetical protein [Mesorhizobium sp. 131-2-1]|uniref:hypothetical protein n=1 Tax=Mesorhizobium sp. 131-2-1 TaxID=2744518 RepID=UPI001928C8A6|nr:hypothetical protein [Mesorhizobium sp. 131-2-1]BCG91424.1 hypothetical protein MesoLj131a_02880 [Mesorhizobium sp. 131-2-1]